MNTEDQPDLLMPNGSSRQQIAPLKNYSSNTQRRTNAKSRIQQLQDLVSQSFNTFNIYGKQPEAAADIVKMFVTVLEDEKIEDITAGFKKWAMDHSAMPTPADIRKICVELKSARAQGNLRPTDYPKPKWSQVIRDFHTDEIIAVYESGKHLSPMQLAERYSGQRFRDSMRREGLE